MHDLQDFNLVELMLADHAARVLAVAAGLRAKARAVAHKLERQVFQFDNRVAHEIRDRIFGSGNQIQIASLDLEQIVLEFRQ